MYQYDYVKKSNILDLAYKVTSSIITIILCRTQRVSVALLNKSIVFPFLCRFSFYLFNAPFEKKI